MDTSKTIKTKNYHIETLRGLAILLVVIGHVIGSDNHGGMKVGDSSFYRYIYCLFENIRMPIFTVISGWVYSLHPVLKENIFIFIRKKIRRLILPLIFVGTLFFILQYITPGTNNKNELIEIWKIYIFPFTIYWYLPSLFIVFVITAFLEYFKLINTYKKWVYCVIISIVISYFQLSHIIPESIPNIFAFKGALYLLPFFIAGVGFNRFKEIINEPTHKRAYLYFFIIGIILQQINYFFPEKTEFYSDLKLPILIGLFSSAYLITLNFKNSFFIWLATYAYTIYLFHAFGTAGGRIILKAIGIHTESLIFLFALLIALFVPILVEKVLIKWKITRILFLGKR